MSPRSSKKKKKRRPVKPLVIAEPEIQSDVHDEPKKPASKFPVDDILQKAEEFIDSFQYELAQKFCQRALEMDPENVPALEISSSLLIEVGSVSSARECLKQAISLQPNTGYQKYLSLAQVEDGETALRYYRKAAEIIQAQLDSSDVSNVGACNNGDELRRDLSTTFCSIAELYMTDLCFQSDAEKECLLCIENATSTCPNNPEAHQVRASFLIVKEQKQEAKTCMEKSLSLWLPTYRASEDDTVDHPVDPVHMCQLSYSSRTNTAKLLIELEMWDKAQEVLDILCEEDDEVVQTWYLLGWLHFLQGQEYFGNARYYLNKAKKVHLKLPSDDSELLEHIDEIVTELGPGDTLDSDDELQNDNENLDIDSNDMENMEQ